MASLLPFPASLAPWLEPLARAATRTAYRTQQASLRIPLVGTQLALRTLLRARGEAPPEALRALRREYDALLERDLANAEAGHYPAELLFQMPVARYARRLPDLALEIPRVVLRRTRRGYRDLPDDVDARAFPPYFRRTFHWQSDGYLSRRSARIYDVSVEFLFMGCADVMRRQVIPPLARAFAGHEGPSLRILDVGCGTGRTLAQIARALPGQRYFGVDLSPFYLEEARTELADVAGVTLSAENAEHLPFRDASFDAVVSVYLFHELPRRTRRAVLAEMLRVLRPGGVLVIEDSAQLAEARDLAPFLRAFAQEMHEPFYRDYVRDDLAKLLAGAGCTGVDVERAWLSKVVSARAPGAGGA